MTNDTLEIQNNQIAIINNSIELFRTAPEVLKANQDRSRKALIVGNSIIDQWAQAWKIEDADARLEALSAVDERSNNFLANCTKALKEEKELRAAITQMMDEFKKMFTTAENDIDRSKSGSVAERIQTYRDGYAKESARVAEDKRREAERIANKQKEEIEIRAKAEIAIADNVNTALASKKQGMVNAFNTITLETYDQKSVALGNLNPAINLADLEAHVMGKVAVTVKDGIRAIYHDVAEVEAIVNASANSFQWDKVSEEWRLAVSDLKQELIEKLPSKLSELQEQKRLADEAAKEAEMQRIADEKRKQEMAAAKEEDRKRLEEKQRQEKAEEDERLAKLKAEQDKMEEDKRKREQEDAQRIAKEQEERKQKAEQDIALKVEGEKTMVLFEQEAVLADVQTAPEARQGYDIEILHPAGYVQIFQLWFESEGKNLPVDKIGSTKMDQMKSWCEKHAHKTGEKIDSKFLKYEASFKAVNRKK